MKKSLKAIALMAMTGALAAGSALSASAATSLYNGQWCDEGDKGWWYKLNDDGSVFLANTWYWIKDSDGVVRCYYFNHDGWLQTNTTIDGCTVDASGRWTENGTVKTDSSKDFATSVDFAQLKAAETKNTATTGTTTTTAVVSKTGKKAYQAKDAGDTPTGTYEQGYGSSSVNGSTAVNSWSNFQITLPGRPTVSSEGAGTDWTYEDDSAGTAISCSYRKVNEFTSSNTTLDGFITGYTSSMKGFAKAKSITKKGKAAKMCTIENLGAKTFGGISFTELRRESLSPAGTGYDYAYVRLVPGTSYVQVIEITGGNDYASVLNTIAAAN